MRTILRSKVTLLILSFGMLLAFAGVALADIVAPDADLVTVGNQAGTNQDPIDMGTVKPGGTLTKQVSFELQCNGTRHVDQGQTVNLSFAGATGVPTGGSATATGTTIGPVPASWTDEGANCPTPAPTPIQDNGNSWVSFTAPSNAANGATYTFRVDWANNNLTPTGTSDSNSVTGSSQVAFKVTVDAQAPDTTITSGPTGTVNSNSATFNFSSNEANSTFETRLDNGAWVSNGTATSKTYTGLADGAHTFDVRATDAVGNTDASPATRSWTVQTVQSQTITFNQPDPKTYGDADFDPGATASSSLAVSYSSSTPGVCTIVGGKVHVVSVGDCTVKASQAGNVSYSAAPDVTQTFAIKKADLTATANSASREYGDANPTFTGTLTGVQYNDGITASYSSAATAASDIGTYNIVPSLSDPNNKLSNYNVVLNNGTLTVTKAPLTIKAADASREYGDANPTFTGSIVSGLKNNDALSVTASSSATQTSPVGTYTIVPALNGANAGNYAVTPQNGTLTIKSWTFSGFYQPVDMNNTLNTIKGGSTVPIKFELFKGTTELTDTGSVQALRYKEISCTALSAATLDDIELTATGGTVLRYDTTGGQYVYNWQTPKTVGKCYSVTISSNDLSSQTAYFKTK